MPNFPVPISENLTISDSLSVSVTSPSLGISPKQVRGLLLDQSDDRLGVSISWLPLAANADTYTVLKGGAVCQSVIAGPSANISDGDTLEIKINGGVTQTITFSNTFITDGAATVNEIVDNINDSLTGATASISNNTGTSEVVLRVPDPKKNSSIEIIGGTAQAELSFPTGLFSFALKTTQYQVLTVTSASTTAFEDRDGSLFDYYKVFATSATGLVGQTSVVKTLSAYFDEVPTRAIIYGYLFDAGGNPSVKKDVIIRPPDDHFPSLDKGLHSSQIGISFDEHRVLSDEDGYFETEVISDIVIRLSIPSINYDLVVRSPVQQSDFTKLLLVHDDLRIRTTEGIISGPALSNRSATAELKIGEVKVNNDDDCPVPIFTPPGEVVEVAGSVSISNFPPGATDPATETTLAALLAKFDGTQDLGDITVLGTVDIATPSPIDVQGTVDVGNFPATQNVAITSSVPLTATIQDPLGVNIIGEGGLALESTLAALSAKFADGSEIGDVTVDNGPGAAAVNIQDGGNVITVDGTVDIGNLPATQDVNIVGQPIDIATPSPIDVQGTVAVSSFPPGAATEATLAALLARLDGTNDIGDVSILGVVPVSGSVAVTGNVDVDNFPANQDVTITGQPISIDDNSASITIDSDGGPIDVNITGSALGAFSVDINDEGGLALETTLQALLAKFADGVAIGDVTVDNGPGAAAVNIQDGGNSITVDGGVGITDTHLPVSEGDQYFFRDNNILVMATDPSDTDFVFGFTSTSIAIWNDEDPTLGGDTSIWYSFDNFATIHGRIKAGEGFVMDDIRQTGITFKSITTPRPYRLMAWGGTP